MSIPTGSSVTVTLKNGKKVNGSLVSAKAGWAVVLTTDGEIKSRTSAVVLEGQKPAPRPRPGVTKKAVPAKRPKGAVDEAKLIEADLEKYTLHTSTTKAGRRHIDIDDDVAAKLREMDLDGVYKYAAEILEVSVNKLRDRYKNLNPGMQRMNLGNKIRAIFRLGDKVSKGFTKHKAAA